MVDSYYPPWLPYAPLLSPRPFSCEFASSLTGASPNHSNLGTPTPEFATYKKGQPQIITHNNKENENHAVSIEGADYYSNTNPPFFKSGLAGVYKKRVVLLLQVLAKIFISPNLL